MSEQFKDYKMIYSIYEVDGINMNVVFMGTPEFGRLRSRYLKAVEDDNINQQLLDSLADELIDEYEDRLKKRK